MYNALTFGKALLSYERYIILILECGSGSSKQIRSVAVHIVDLEFKVTGKTIPADHGYVLYSALSKHIPALHPHEADREPAHALWRCLGVHPVNGRLCGDRKIALGDASRLRVRLPAEMIQDWMPLAGKTLDIDGHAVHVGMPMAKALLPLPTLRSRLVTIKGYQEPEAFLEAAKKQAAALGIHGEVMLVPVAKAVSAEGNSTTIEDRCPYIRRTIRISNKEIVGYALRVTNLTAAESLDLQEQGIGGRRRFGCGIFVPDKN